MKNEDEFLAGLDTEDIDLIETEPTDDLFGTKEIIEIDEVKIEKPVPYHKDEKLQRYIDKQVEKRTKDLKPSAQDTFKQDLNTSGDDDIVRALTRLVGNDTDEKREVLNDLKTALDKRDERATEKAYTKIQEYQKQQAEEEKQQVEQAEEELEEGFEEIETAFNVDLTSGTPQANRLRSAYSDFLQKIGPKNGYQEYPDFTTTFELFKNSVQKRSTNVQAKSLASRGMDRSTTTSTEVKSKGNSWQDVDRMIEASRK